MKTQSPAKPAHYYGQILKSSSIIGGSQGINYLIGMVRVKVVAVLLGPSGVGLVGLYLSATSLVETFAGLGIGSSGVREVAEAYGSGMPEQIARTVKTLHRACWVTGILGWLLCAAFSYPLSVYTFGTGDHTWAVAILGSTTFLDLLAGGQSALIQGTRRISDFARKGVFGAVASTIVAVTVYALLGQNGILLVLIATAFVNLGFSWWFSRRIPLEPIALTWAETFRNSRRLVHIGVVFMYGAIIGSVVDLTIRSLIVKNHGMDASGIFQAAWSISGMFAGFILGAMAADFYPHLTSISHDNERVNRLVNEQTEIGILLALPGLLGTLAFAPWVMRIFYSAKFLSGAELLPWFLLGIFGQVISWPLGMIQMAKGATKWMFFSRSFGQLIYLGFVLLLIKHRGLPGVAMAFALFVYIHAGLQFLIARKITHFKWKIVVYRLVATSIAILSVGLLFARYDKSPWILALNSALVALTGAYSLRAIITRLGPNHRISLLARRIPGIGFSWRS